MSDGINLGSPFAYAFFAVALKKTHPSSMFVFSETARVGLPLHKRSTRRVNILWRGARMLTCFPEALPDTEEKLSLLRQQSVDIAITRTNVEARYGGVLFRGVFTTENYIVSKLNAHMKVVGPSIILENFEDGPIRRVDPPRSAEERFKLRTGF